ncbi:MAG TPA: diacylglycerol kinase family protein [Anaeromyxobacteraceae bacterium]|nr:diacylglycerol kinase family protein [Anaeromyxobacteraceae bacterium]
MKPCLIVNPASANGRTGRNFDTIARVVRTAIGDFEALFTRARGDGARLAREALGQGARLVVAVGGDGTASEVVDGMLHHPRDPDVLFGFIPRGTGGDFRRSAGIPVDVGEAARVLAGSGTLAIDLGRIEFRGHDGSPRVRHFANVAGCGISGAVVQKVESTTKALGGKASFTIASARALLGWRDVPVRWRADGGPWVEQAITGLNVCNGSFFGGGMRVAPEARMDDGLFDVVIWSGLGLVDLLTKRRMLCDGSHVRLPNTRVLRARDVEVEPLEGATILLDVDGEQPGVLPARFSLLPGALRIRAR